MTARASADHPTRPDGAPDRRLPGYGNTTLLASSRGETAVMTFDDLGFAHDYGLDLDPEFPGDGEWSGPTRGFDEAGAGSHFLESRWGAPTIVRIEPAGAPSWTASFPGGSGGATLSGFFGLPARDHALVVIDGWAAIIDTRSSEALAEIVGRQVRQVVRVPDEDMVLLGGHSDVVALGREGSLWRSQRLFLDDLQIVRVAQGQILCSGYSMGTTDATIDLETGRTISGPAMS